MGTLAAAQHRRRNLEDRPRPAGRTQGQADRAGQGLGRGGGSKVDLGALYGETHGRLRRAAIYMGADADVAEDLVQLTFLVAHQRLVHFEARSDPSTWLFGILFNVYRNHHRAAGRTLRRLEAFALVEHPEPSRQISAAYVACLLEQVLAKLEPERRQLLLLRMAGLSMREISAQFKISIHTTYSRLAAARRQVQSVTGDGH